jgi:hypothetical protein
MTTLADPTLPHQIVLNMTGSHIYVSCNCLATRQGSVMSWQKIETRGRWTAQEALSAYRQWHADRGIELEAPHGP